MKIARYLAGDSKIVFAIFHGNRLKIDWEIGEKTCDFGYRYILKAKM